MKVEQKKMANIPAIVALFEININSAID